MYQRSKRGRECETLFRNTAREMNQHCPCGLRHFDRSAEWCVLPLECQQRQLPQRKLWLGICSLVNNIGVHSVVVYPRSLRHLPHQSAPRFHVRKFRLTPHPGGRPFPVRPYPSSPTWLAACSLRPTAVLGLPGPKSRLPDSTGGRCTWPWL